jgi:hypothetical protein
MQARRVFALLAAALMVFAAGCASSRSNQAKARFRETPGSFSDTTARTTYVNERVDELTATGMSREAATARASREWFARAPVASQEPTAYEIERRKAQADLNDYLSDYRASAKR